MAILSGIPVLNCQSIETTLDFYQQILQFVIVKKRESNGSLVWVHLMHGNTTLMLQSSGQSTDKEYSPQSNISLYYFVNNINELHHFIAVNYKAVSNIKSTDYQMQEFSLLDPEGNRITIGQAANSQS